MNWFQRWRDKRTGGWRQYREAHHSCEMAAYQKDLEAITDNLACAKNDLANVTHFLRREEDILRKRRGQVADLHIKIAELEKLPTVPKLKDRLAAYQKATRHLRSENERLLRENIDLRVKVGIVSRHVRVR